MAKSFEIPAIELAGDGAIPQFGLGVFQVPPEETFENVTHALDAGYRHIDTAKAYGNEAEVGQAVARPGSTARASSSPRSCGTTTRYDARARAQDQPRQLEMDYVDLYLIHWPAPGGGPATSRPGRR